MQPSLLEIPLDDALFKVLSSDSRREILRMLLERRMTGTELAQRLELGKPAVSEHLKKLHEAGLVERHDDAERRWVYFSLSKTGRDILEPKKTRFILVLSVAIVALLIGSVVGFALYSSVAAPLPPPDVVGSSFGSGIAGQTAPGSVVDLSNGTYYVFRAEDVDIRNGTVDPTVFRVVHEAPPVTAGAREPLNAQLPGPDTNDTPTPSSGPGAILLPDPTDLGPDPLAASNTTLDGTVPEVSGADLAASDAADAANASQPPGLAPANVTEAATGTSGNATEAVTSTVGNATEAAATTGNTTEIAAEADSAAACVATLLAPCPTSPSLPETGSTVAVEAPTNVSVPNGTTDVPGNATSTQEPPPAVEGALEDGNVTAETDAADGAPAMLDDLTDGPTPTGTSVDNATLDPEAVGEALPAPDLDGLLARLAEPPPPPVVGEPVTQAGAGDEARVSGESSAVSDQLPGHAERVAAPGAGTPTKSPGPVVPWLPLVAGALLVAAIVWWRRR